MTAHPAVTVRLQSGWLRGRITATAALPRCIDCGRVPDLPTGAA